MGALWEGGGCKREGENSIVMDKCLEDNVYTIYILN